MPIRETYPEHPMTSIKPKIGTFTELRQKRQDATK